MKVILCSLLERITFCHYVTARGALKCSESFKIEELEELRSLPFCPKNFYINLLEVASIIYGKIHCAKFKTRV